MRIEIKLGMNPKISQSAIDAFDADMNRCVAALYPDTEVQVSLESHTRIEMAGIMSDEDRRRVRQLLENAWENDSLSR